MGGTLSKCLNRGFVTMTFSEPTLNPVISFAGWGGADGGAKSWSELELVTPNVSLTMLSGTNLQVIGGTYVGIVDPSPGTRCTSAAGCGSLQVNGTVTEVKFALNYNANGSGWGNEDQWNIVASVVEDFGQLPTRYDAPAASHVVGLLKLGSVVTADNLNVLYGTTNADAVSYGSTIPVNEDGISSLGALNVTDAGQPYSLTVALSGVERTARLCGWIDFNRDGTMSLAERTCATNPAAGATSATLNWTVPSDIVAGLTYARVRLSYDAVPIPSGKVSSGEVEDYSINIAASAIPNAVNDTSTNAQDINQVISPLTNDVFEDGFPPVNSSLLLCGYGTGPFACDKTSLTVPGEGTYTVNSNGTVTFDPLPNYVGTATPVQYQISDTQSRARTATITPTVTPSPTATSDATRDYVNITQSKNVLSNDTPGVGVFSVSNMRLCSAGQSPTSCSATTVSVTGGVYTLNTSTGVITFVPATDWVGTAPPVTYQVSDGSGQIASATYTPTVVSQPTATNDASFANYDVTQTIRPLLNDTPGGSPLAASTLRLCGIDDPTTSGTNESESPNNCTKTSLTIPGEGTYTVNSDGTVTFDPLPTFYGTASPRPYQISDALGETASATITPSVGTPPLPTAQPNTSTGAYDTNQSLSPLDGDTPGSSSFPLQVSSIRLCGIADNTVTPPVAAELPNNCSSTSVTVPGEGTYTLNTTTGVVTFDPLPTFTGQVQTPVRYQVKDSLDRFVNSTLTPTVGAPPVPTATADALTRGYDANHTYTPLGNDTSGASDFPLLATSVKLCGINPAESPNNCTQTTLTVPGEGTYTVNGDGTVTFDPLPTFTGTVATPVKYQAKDTLDRFVDSTMTPTVGPPPVPTATADAITDAYNTNQTYTPLGNDTRGATDFPLLATSVKLCGINPAESPNNCTQTTLTVPGEGTYTVNGDGTVTFDPLPTFTGQVQTPVKYQAKDSLDRFVDSTMTPTVGPPPVPTATADAITDAYNTNQTYTPLGNDTRGATDFPLLATSVKLCGLADATATPPVSAESPNTCSKTSLTVPGEGTYTVNSDGTVTFDPLPSFTGTVQTAVRYQANDSLDRYVDSTITPTVNEPPGPVAQPNTSSGDYNVNQTINPLGNDVPSTPSFPLDTTSVKLCGINPAESPNNCTQTSLTVPGEGTYTLDPATGLVTFDPLPTFTGTVQTPVKYQAQDSLGRYLNSTITPTVGLPPDPTATADVITDDYDTNQTYTPLDNDTAGATDFPLQATSVKLCGLDDPATLNTNEAESPNDCTKTSVIVPGEGTYTLDLTTGVVVFNPLPTFTGTVTTPVTYQAKDSLDRFVDSTITPTVGLPPVPTATADAITDDYDTNQTYTPLGNDTAGAADFPLLASSVKLCGINPVQTPNSCDKTSLTVPGEGTYTVNNDGTVTFDPLPTFSGTVTTPVTYQAKDSLDRFVDETITPTVTAPPINVVDDTSSGLYDTNQLIPVLDNDTPGAQWVPSSVKLCGISPAESPNNCTQTSLTVPGEGTYTVNPDGTVTFNPLPSFTGTAQTPVRYQVTDILGRTEDATITPTVGPPPAPTASPDALTRAYDTNQTYAPLANDSAGAADFPLLASSVKLCGINPVQTPNSCDKTSLTVPGEGTYTVNNDGTVTFDPLPTFTGTVATPVTYQAKDSLNRFVDETITPTVGLPPDPTATADAITDDYDTNQIYTPLGNDTAGATDFPLQASSVKLCGINPVQTPNSCDKTSLTVPGEGTYTVNNDGTVTFDPLPTFTGTVATPVTYQAKDSLNRFVDETISPTVDPPAVPTATPQTQSVLPGATATYTTVIGPNGLGTGTGLQSGATNGPCLVNPATTLCGTSVNIPNEGTWTIDQTTGVVTFAASQSVTSGQKTSVEYRITDIAGQTATSTLTPVVPPAPDVKNDTSIDAYDTNQVIDILDNDDPGHVSAPLVASSVKLCGINPLQTPNSCDKTSLTVPGEGMYTVNPDGTVTFNPLATFAGTVATPVTYQVADTLGQIDSATITPTVTPPPINVVDDTSSGLYDTNQVIPVLVNDTPGAQWVASSVKLCGINPTETPNNCTQTSLTVPGEGTYTVNPDGTVTFDPLPSFTGTAQTPVRYQVTDVLGRTEDATITPTVGPPPVPTASPDALTRAYDTNQTYTPLGNDSAGATDFPLSASSVKLCGVSPAETPNNCTKTSLTVPGEGTYTVNGDGTVTFDPLPTFVGTVATPLKYQAKDSLDRFVNTTITPTVLPPPVPTASPDAITNDYDTNQTYTPLGNDTPGAADFPLLASSVKLCGINPAQTPNSCDKTSLTVPGEGTYTVNGDGTVTFDPLPTFTGTVATPVTYQAKDSLNRFLDETITPTVGLPPVPTASPDAIADDYDTNQTYTPLGNDTPGVADFPLLASSVKLCGINPVQTPNGCDKTSLTVPGEGTYTVNGDGTVTFNPLPTFTGTVATPVTYQAKDSLDRFIDETITPTVGLPPAPTASPDALTRAYDTNQSYTPLGNDTPGVADFPLLASSVKLCGVSPAETPNNCTKTSLTVPGEGTYTVNGDGTVTFDPLPTFVGTVATPVTYQAKDSLDRFVNTTITPTVLPPPIPTASPDAITTAYDTNQTYTPLGNDTAGAADFPLSATSVKLCGINPAQTPNSCDKTSLTVPGEGTYTVNPDGTVSFDPLPTFVGTVATPVKYQAKDSLDRFVNTTITPTILPPPVPTASPDAITDDYDTNQTYTPLGNDTPGAADFSLLASSVKLCGINPVQTPNSCDKTSLTVPGEGTYTVNNDGTVSFDPLPTFVGTVATPVKYQAKDSLDRFVNTTITPTVLPPPVPTASPDAITTAYDTNQTYTPLGNDTPGAADFPLLASSVKLCGINPVQTPNSCDKTSLTVPGEGTYTVNNDGTVTFDPLPTFTGTVATPVTYQAKDSLNRFVNTTITPTILTAPITVADDVKTGPYDTNQTIDVLLNDTPSAQWIASSVKLCGVTPVETPDNCTKTSVTVPGEGTYTVNADGTVTFDPLPTFKGTVATPVTYQVTDVLGRTADADITPTVLPPPPPVATPQTQLVVPLGTATYTNVIGTSALATGTQLQSGSTNGPCLIDPSTTMCGTSVVIAGQGTWTIDRTTGIATFVADAGITPGTKTSVTYRVTDIVGQTATSTLTPIVPPPPSATDDYSSGPFDTNQTLTPFSNDSFDSMAPARATSLRLCGAGQTPNGCTQTSVVVPNEGTFTINSGGTVTFDPLPSFVGAATPLPYQAEDIFGRFVDAALHPSVAAPDVPVATPQTKVVAPGTQVAFTNVIGSSALATGAQLQSGSTNGPCLVDPSTSTCGTTVVIAGEGTWTIDQSTGIAVFDAEPGITPGTKTSVTYRVTDVIGQTATSTLTPIVPPPPSANNDAMSSSLDENQMYAPLNNDSFNSLSPAAASTLRLCGAGQNPNTCDKATLTVANEGTFTVNANGTVLFDPLPNFVGTAAPVTYQVADILGRIVNATITPTILPPPVPEATQDTGRAKEGNKVILQPWLNDSAGVLSAGQVGRPALIPTSVRLCPISTVAKTELWAAGQADPACTLMKVTTVDGTYTVDPKTGKVTFVHRKGFSGTVTQPVNYQISSSWRVPAGTLTARSVLIPTIISKRIPMVTIGNKVWRDVNGDGYQNRLDRGIKGVKVTISTTAGGAVTDIFGNVVGPVFTNKMGLYRFADLPAGQYKVTVTYPRGMRATLANRPGRKRNSSTNFAISQNLSLGQTDDSLDFGMVAFDNTNLPMTR
jgi:CshA-type fibril repeat protein